MSKKKLAIILIGLYLYMPFSQALQEKTLINPDSRVKANISKDELNRIFIDSDKIEDVKGDFSRFILEADETNGQIFIMPNKNKTAPMSLFLVSELHNTISLLLTPKDIKAETIKIIVPRTRKTIGMIETRKPAKYQSNVLGLIQSMFSREPSSGVQVISIKKGWPKTSAALRVTQIKEYRSDQLSGYILKVVNPSCKESRSLIKDDFHHDSKTVAITLEQNNIPAEGSTYAYVVKQRGDGA